MSNPSACEESTAAKSDPGHIDNNVTHTKRHEHHAHFVEPQQQDDLEAHDSKILIERMGENILKVRLGFLQVMHVYNVQFSIEDDLGNDVSFDPLENVHVDIQSVSPSEDGKGHAIVLIFSALKEKIMQETVTLTSKDDQSRTLILELHARVLGKGKGTPSLKKGIHFVRIEWDEETDGSDWQEF